MCHSPECTILTQLLSLPHWTFNFQFISSQTLIRKQLLTQNTTHLEVSFQSLQKGLKHKVKLTKKPPIPKPASAPAPPFPFYLREHCLVSGISNEYNISWIKAKATDIKKNFHIPDWGE